MRAEPLGRRLRWAGGAVALVVAMPLALGACGGDDEEPSVDAPPPREQAQQGQPDEPPSDGGGRPRRDGDERQKDEAAGSDGERSRAAEVVAAIDAVLASGDSDLACADAVTERYVERSWGTGQACRLSQDPEMVATRIMVDDVTIVDRGATATVDVEGGLYDGLELDARVVYEAGAWRVDRLSADVPAGP